MSNRFFLHKSVWEERKDGADSGTLYDTPEVTNLAFGEDVAAANNAPTCRNLLQCLSGVLSIDGDFPEFKAADRQLPPDRATTTSNLIAPGLKFGPDVMRPATELNNEVQRIFTEPWVGDGLKRALRIAYPTILHLYQYYCGLSRSEHLYLDKTAYHTFVSDMLNVYAKKPTASYSHLKLFKNQVCRVRQEEDCPGNRTQARSQ